MKKFRRWVGRHQAESVLIGLGIALVLIIAFNPYPNHPKMDPILAPHGPVAPLTPEQALEQVNAFNAFIDAHVVAISLWCLGILIFAGLGFVSFMSSVFSAIEYTIRFAVRKLRGTRELEGI